MAVQALWSGTIGFSLVAIPVRLVSAMRPARISFHLLHSTDHSRLSRTMTCPEDGATVGPDEIVRGFEISEGAYVPVTDEELESLSPERSRTIEIAEFIDLKEVDPVYYDHPYYLVPAKGGEKAYRLLAEAMRRTNRAGLARFVFGEREYLVAVISRDGALALITLHYSDDIRPRGDDSSEAGTAAADEKDRIKKSIVLMTADFDPAKYADGRRERIRKLLETKVKEHALVEAPAASAEEDAGPPDLVAALEESMRRMKENR